MTGAEQRVSGNEQRVEPRRTYRNLTELPARPGKTSWTTCYVRDIERDCKDFNEVRTTFFRWHRLNPLPRRIRAARRGRASIDRRTLLVVLLGGDAGLRCGELALEWADIDLAKRQLCVRRSDWNGQVGTPNSGRLRFVPLTQRLAVALAEHRHLRSRRVLCQDNGEPFTRQIVQNRMNQAARRANVRKGVHILRHTFCSHLSMRGAPARAIQVRVTRI